MREYLDVFKSELFRYKNGNLAINTNPHPQHQPNPATHNQGERFDAYIKAVKAAINKAKICKKPIAGYDKEKKRAYVEYANGERKYV